MPNLLVLVLVCFFFFIYLINKGSCDKVLKDGMIFVSCNASFCFVVIK